MLPDERVRRVALSYMQQRVPLFFELLAEQRIVAGVHHIHLHEDLTTPQVKIALLRESPTPLLLTSANTSWYL